MAPDKVQQVIEKQLGKPIDEVFAWIDLANPLGSASIAQVRIAHAGMVICSFGRCACSWVCNSKRTDTTANST